MSAALAAGSVVALGTEVAKVINGVLAKLPTYEQKKIEEFLEFERVYHEEIRSADSDTDYLITLRYRRSLLLNALVSALKTPRQD